MKQLIKTDDYASLETVDYGRVVYRTTCDLYNSAASAH